jgi:hypothetical protein
MPQLDRAALSGTDLEKIKSQVTVVEEEVLLMVFRTDDQLFRKFVEASYDAHLYKWEAHHNGAAFKIDKGEWVSYAFTMLRSRLARVNDEPRQIRCDDEWMAPAMIATVVNAIGRVTIDTPAMVYKPVWNPQYDAEVMPREKWLQTTARLRALAADREFTKFTFVRSLSGDRTGDRMIMDLVPVRDAQGRIAQLRSEQPIDGVAAFVYLACGFMPDIYDEVPAALHARLLPRWYIEAAAARYGADELGLRSA